MVVDRGKISVIVPAYNASFYLECCIESILRQSYSNIELIIVDDGSKDDTLHIAKKLAQSDSRVIVMHQENRGLPAARNAGLKQMTGQYVCFIDADDWLEPDCLEKAVDKQIEYAADMVFFSYYREYAQKKLEYHAYNRELVYDHSGNPEFDLFNMKTITAWGKLYTAQSVKDIFFDENMRTAEDVDFNFRVYSRIHKAVYVPQCLLHYRILPKSAIHGYDAHIQEKFQYPIHKIRSYMMGDRAVENQAYFSFAAIAYIVIAQNGIALNKELTIAQKFAALRKLNKEAWAEELFRNMRDIHIPWSRKAIIQCAKYNLNFGILLAVKIKQIMGK